MSIVLAVIFSIITIIMCVYFDTFICYYNCNSFILGFVIGLLKNIFFAYSVYILIKYYAMF